jgi:putative endonuclease
MRSSHVDRGRWAEAMAAAFLSLHGFRILEHNFRFSRLEIDLIARKADVLAVVEVKYRGKHRLGGAVGAVGLSKQRDLETATVGYLRLKGLTDVRVRFDVVTIEPAPRTANALLIRHIENAFPATGRYRG